MFKNFNMLYAVLGVMALMLIVIALIAVLGMSKAWALAIPAGVAAGVPKDSWSDGDWWTGSGASDDTDVCALSGGPDNVASVDTDVGGADVDIFS